MYFFQEKYRISEKNNFLPFDMMSSSPERKIRGNKTWYNTRSSCKNFLYIKQYQDSVRKISPSQRKESYEIDKSEELFSFLWQTFLSLSTSGNLISADGILSTIHLNRNINGMNYSQLPFHSSSRENCKYPFNGGDILNSTYFGVYYVIFSPVQLNIFKCLRTNLFIPTH